VGTSERAHSIAALAFLEPKYSLLVKQARFQVSMPRRKESFGRAGRNIGINPSTADAMDLAYKRCPPPTGNYMYT
jgi:hypothetical protein